MANAHGTARPRTNTARILTIVSFVFAVIALLLFPLVFGLIGLVLGIAGAVLGDKPLGWYAAIANVVAIVINLVVLAAILNN